MKKIAEEEKGKQWNLTPLQKAQWLMDTESPPAALQEMTAMVKVAVVQYGVKMRINVEQSVLKPSVAHRGILIINLCQLPTELNCCIDTIIINKIQSYHPSPL